MAVPSYVVTDRHRVKALVTVVGTLVEVMGELAGEYPYPLALSVIRARLDAAQLLLTDMKE